MELPQRLLDLGATAAVCVNDGFAIELIQAAQASGVSIPGNLSIIGVDNADAGQWNLTSMGFSFQEVGRCAVDGLVNLIAGGPLEESRLIIPVQLYERESVKDMRHGRTS